MPDTVTLKKLCEYDLLLREDESVSREFLDHIFALENIVVTPVMESISNQALISAAVQNLGVTIMSEALLTRQLNNGGLRKITVSDYEFTRNPTLFTTRTNPSALLRKIFLIFAIKTTSISKTKKHQKGTLPCGVCLGYIVCDKKFSCASFINILKIFFL
jgi:DNA-binding transcriptional LysR family regulator